jgi:hypothetical protein
MERPELVDPLKEEEQTPVEQQTEDAFSVREQAEQRLGKVGTGALDFVPIVGDVLAAGDVADSYRRGDKLGTAVNIAALGVGVVPIIGDLAAKGIKKGFGIYKKASKVDDELLDKGLQDVADADVAPTVDMRRFADDFKNEQDAIDLSLDKDEISIEEWKTKSKENNETYKKVSGISITDIDPVLEQSAVKFYKDIEAGVPYETARAEHLKKIEERKPIREWDNLPNASSETQQVLAVDAGKRKRGFFAEVSKKTADKLSKKLGHPIQRIKIPKGAEIFGRLDVDAYSDYNAWVSTIGVKGPKAGDAAGKRIYGDAVHYVALEDGKVRFDVSETIASQIAKGELRKRPFAVIRGLYEPTSPAQIRKKVKALLKDPEWTQVGFDPRRLTAFYTRNKAENQPVGSLVESADEVFQIGPLILAKNVKRLEEQRLNKGGAIKTYKEGGVVPMQEQMKFAFMNEGGVLADDGVERDPVSGNEVPAGSMAEEVRDDVPAMLSEGEYVVPADVVRYHGIDKFEQLRDEAKAGLARMEADGRIGGQPVEEQEEFPFPVEELQGFDEGGVVGDIYPDVMGSPYTPGQRYSSDRFPGVGFELRNFTNPKTGKTVVIPFYNGQPMQYIPQDFLEGGAATTGGGTFDPAADERSRQEDEAERARNTTDRGMSDLAYDAATKALRGDVAPTIKAVSEMTPLELKAYNDQRNSIIGRTLANVPVLGFLMKLDEKKAKERSLDILAKGKNPENNLPLTSAEVSALREVVNQQERKGFLQAIGDWIKGQKFYDPNPRLGYESGQDFQQMYPDLLTTEYTPSPKTAPDFVTMGEIGTSAPTSAPFGTDLEGSLPTELLDQESGFADQEGTVGEEAQKILDKEGMYDQKKVDKAAGERVNKLFNILSSPAQAIREVLGAKPAGAQTTSNSPLLQGFSEEDIATINQFSRGESSVAFDDIVNSPTLNSTDVGPTAMNGGPAIQNGRFVPYVDTEGFITVGAGYRLRDSVGNLFPNVSELSDEQKQSIANQTYDINAINKEILDVFSEKKNFVENRYTPVLDTLVNTKKISPATRTIVKRSLIDLNMQLTGGTTAFTLADRALMDGNIDEFVNQLTGNYKKDGKPSFSYEEGATYEGPTAYVTQMAGKNKDILDNRNRAINHGSMIKDALANDKKDTSWIDNIGPLSQSIPKQDLTSQPLQQTYTPPQAPTADDIRLAGGLDNFVKSTLPSGAEQRTTGLQDLPVGVSIEADGQFTGTGGLGAVQAPSVGTPIVKRDFLDPSMSMSRREVLSDPTRFRGPTGAGIGPMSEDERLQTGLATDFNRFTERADRTPITVPRTADDKPITTQMDAMLGETGASGTLPQMDTTSPKKPTTPFTPLGRPSDISQLVNKAAKDAAKEAVQEAISFAPKTPKKTKPKAEAEETISQQEYKKRVADATRKENEKARDRADKARDSVLQQGGSVQEAFDAAQTAFTGFTPSGEFVGATDPGTAAMNRFSKGGLASKSKKTKPKKRDTKKGLGGRMAT